MKKIWIMVLLLVFLAAPGFAATRRAKAFITKEGVTMLQTAAGVNIAAVALTSGEAVYSEAIDVTNNIGFATLICTVDAAGDVDISVEYSINGTDWYTAYVSDMAGALTADGNIVTALSNATRWMAHTVRLAKYMRYKFDPDANSTITAYAIYQEDR